MALQAEHADNTHTHILSAPFDLCVRVCLKASILCVCAWTHLHKLVCVCAPDIQYVMTRIIADPKLGVTNSHTQTDSERVRENVSV